MLKVPVISANFVRLAEQAVKENHSHIGYLEALLAMESEERDRHAVANRLHGAKLPRMKTLEEFEFARAPQIPAAKIRELAEGGYIMRAEPVVLIGECGTGKTHLATGLCVAACRQKRKVRFTTTANLVNELVEASQQHGVRRVLARWMRYDVIALDEVGYVPLAEIGAEFLFQVIAERAERATLIVTTNLPFSEWTQVFPNLRLCKALLDRITDRAHKGLIKKKFGSNTDVAEAIDKLQTKPDSPGRREILSEELNAVNAAGEPELLRAAQSLLELIKALPQGEQHIQTAQGTGIAQADRGGTATVKIIGSPSKKIDD
jgi:DNA replication protein DnaC